MSELTTVCGEYMGCVHGFLVPIRMEGNRCLQHDAGERSVEDRACTEIVASVPSADRRRNGAGS